MSRDSDSDENDELTQALAWLGVDLDAPEELDPALWRVHLANSLLGAAERHLLEAELDAARAGIGGEKLDTASHHTVDAAAGWGEAHDHEEYTRTVLHWRSGLLHRAIDRALPEETATDPVLVAAHDAAALTNTLLGYRTARESELDDDPQRWQGHPEAQLRLARELVDQLTRTLRELSQ